MQLLARLLLIVPSIIAGWFVSKDDVSYWVVAFAIALVFIALTIAFELYVHPWLRRRG
ncbi:hypothetical protein [uncultured Bosea sp.]|uniref:hypothetical protein n=1 Tax=uncultured Bosea sp. TaxID=211457 RepID=UPI0025CE9252|nr:hypothetical protein [uncultured Bosea sp.]